jgi:hypothetical protein
MYGATETQGVTVTHWATEQVGLVGVDQRHVVVVAEHGDDLFGLALPQKPVIDEDAGELIADGLVDQHRRD